MKNKLLIDGSKFASFMILPVFFLTSLCFAEEAALEDYVKFPKNGTVEQCQKVYDSSGVQDSPTAIRRGLNSLAEDCFKRAMNRDLDKRLLDLKKRAPDSFKKEMALQKLFNEAVTSYCDQWESYYQKCASTGSFSEQSECKIDLYRYRDKQAIAITSSRLSLKEESGNSQEMSKFSPFAKELCAIPNLGWAGGTPPANCASRVLSELEKSVRGAMPSSASACHDN